MSDWWSDHGREREQGGPVRPGGRVVTDRIHERVRKLLALSRSSNEHEAEAAALKAQELLQKYHLDRADVELDNPDGVEVDSQDYAGAVIEWARDLAFAVGRGMFCRAVHTPRGPGTGGRSWVHWVGKPDDVAAARALFEYLRKELKRLASAEWKKRATHREVPAGCLPIEWKQAFFRGAVWGLDGKLRAAVRRFEGLETGRALVRRTSDAIEEKVAQQFREVRQSPMGRPIVSGAGWVAGLQAAERLPTDIRKSLPEGG